MSEVEEVLAALNEFNHEREWTQFHNPKDLALALSIEASELLELFLWKRIDTADSEDIDVDALKNELADVFAYALLLMQKYDLNFKDIILAKMRQNAVKYPIDKSKGKAEKYNKL